MADDNRGLASADEKTRERVAKAGGEAVSQDREHMAEIGKKGGEAVSQDREHMSEIGQKGGEARGGNPGNRGFQGDSETHAEAGSQSHKND